MTERTDLLRRVRVASPCAASWDRMEGDARVRFCRECNLNVYNLSEMTRAEAEALVARTEGRLCARFYRRADGTVLTQDCPKGLRAVRARVSRAAGAGLAAVLSLFAVAQAKPHAQKKSCPAGVQIKVEKKTVSPGALSTVSGVVSDTNGARVPGAEVVLTDEATAQKSSVKTSSEGEFIFPQPAAGKYTLEISSPGFVKQVVEHLEVSADEAVRVEATLRAGEPTMGVLIVTTEPDIESANGVTIFRSKAITSLPY